MNSELCGILPVYKEQDWTSFDVIAKLRGMLHMKKLGHGGTLDPMAEGVLPVFVGKAAKACDMIPDRDKAYTAGFKLGISTDTEDITGKVQTSCDRAVSREEIEALLPEFTGEIEQLPPMYSAVKVGGKKLYELAREGKTVERRARAVRVDSLRITEYDPESREGIIEIRCGKGTYIRTIISDIGQRLGSGGVMTSLVRAWSGGVGIGQCMKLSEIEKALQEKGAEALLIPLDRAFSEYPEIRLGRRETGLYRNGVKLRAQQTGREPEEGELRIYGSEGEFLGIGYFEQGLLRSRKNFYT